MSPFLIFRKSHQRTFINHQSSQEYIYFFKLDLTKLVNLSHKNEPLKTKVPFIPLPSKPTTTRLETEEGEGTIEAEKECPFRVQIPHPCIGSNSGASSPLPSPSIIKASTRQLAGNISRYLSNWKRITNNNFLFIS